MQLPRAKLAAERAPRFAVRQIGGVQAEQLGDRAGRRAMRRTRYEEMRSRQRIGPRRDASASGLAGRRVPDTRGSAHSCR